MHHMNADDKHGKRQDGNCTSMSRAVLNKSKKQPPHLQKAVVWPLVNPMTNNPSKMNKTRWELRGMEGWTQKWRSRMYSKNDNFGRPARITDIRFVWTLESRKPARSHKTKGTGGEREGEGERKRERESQRTALYLHDLMMMMMIMMIFR